MAADATHVRLDEHARRIGVIEATNPAVTASKVHNLKEDLVEVRDEVRYLKRAFWGLAITIAGSSLLFAATSFVIWGQP